MGKLYRLILIPIMVMLSASSLNTNTPIGLEGPSNTAVGTSFSNRVIILSTAVTSTYTPSPTAPSSSNWIPGSTIQHRVAVGDWLIQIARCYGADLAAVRNANPQLNDYDSNSTLLPAGFVTVPNIGSVGKIYGLPCVVFHQVQNADTWASIAQRYNADVSVLQKVNPGGLVTGKSIKVPFNSADPALFTLQDGPLHEQATLSPSQRLSYQFNAKKGDRFSVELLASLNKIGLALTGPMGIILNFQDLIQNWHGTIPADGNYLISVANVVGVTEETYKLLVQFSTATSTPMVSPPVPEPIQTLEQKFVRNDELIQLALMASIAYNRPPKTMQINQTVNLELVLNRSLASDLLSTQLSESDQVETADIKITDKVKAELLQEADGFIITSKHANADQPIGMSETARWTWSVTARTPGQHQLTLVIHRLIPDNEQVNWLKAGTAYEDQINVTVAPAERINWEWMVGIILTALLIPAFWRWIDQRKKAAEQASKTKPKKKKISSRS